MRHHIFIHVVALGLSLLTAAQAIAQDDPPPLAVGFVPIPPFAEINTEGERAGFVIELAREIASEIGLEVTFVDVGDSQAFIQAQINGDTHMIAGVARLPSLQETNMFSGRVATETLRLSVLNERASEISSRPLMGLRIGIVPPAVGSHERRLLESNQPVDFDTPEAAIMSLLTREVDALLIPEPVVFSVAKLARLDDRIGFLPPPVKQFERFIALHESRGDLLEDIETALARIEADGRLADLRARYFIDLPPPPPEVLKVGVYHFPPYQIVTETGEFNGFGVETLRDLAQSTGLQLSFEAITLEEWEAGPGPDRYDILPPKGVNSERQSRMDFTTAVEKTPISIFMRQDEASGVRGLDDLAGLKVGVQEANLAYDIVQERTDFDLVLADDAEDLIASLLDGRTDAIIYPASRVRLAARAGGFESQIREITPPVLRSQRAIALRFGLGDVRERLNTVIPSYLISDDYVALRDRYFGQPVFWTQQRINLAAGIAGALTLLLLCAIAFVQLRARAKVEAERTRRAAEVSHIRDELETVLNAATSGIVALDKSGRIVRVNNRARHMLGGISDQTPFDWPDQIRFLNGDTLTPMDASADPIRRVLSGHRLRGETHLLRRPQPGAEQRYVRVESAFLESSEHDIAVVLVIDDVSNEERNRQVVERKSRLDALGQLTGGIAHDFNNLLAALLYSVELAQNTTDPERRTKYLSVASGAISKGRDLTVRLLAFAKRQPGLANSKPVSAIFNDFEELIRPMIEEKVEITFASDTAGLQVYCDQTQLETAMMNLVLNSRDAILRSGHGNRIDIKARAVHTTSKELDSRQDGGEFGAREATPKGASYRYAEISVTDNGPGMDEETVARSIDPFFTTKDTNSGTGLGLSMVYGFVRQSDGDLKLYSEEGVGTTVQLTLPRGTDLGRREAPVEDKAPVPGGGETILLVEDEPDLLVMMQNVLEDLGYQILLAQSGEQALTLVDAGSQFDLLLTDVVMPGSIGGFELARQLRERRPEVPVLYTSGYTGFTATEMGEVQAPLLQKPAPPAELAEAISKALAS
ncbi:transporter substrate-binding domain-containing protein [Roseobacter sp. EG26]|uniref:transporter substrate-binding domain-containing protein n=1 Tax=Roseobacter sp. EG26 TaxID=3412477 RepID=UPI003CE5A0E2